MAGSTLVTDYLGRGTHAARPTTPPVASGGTALYFETDTGSSFIWSGSAWVQISGATPAPNPAVVQVACNTSTTNFNSVTLGAAPTAGNLLLAFLTGSLSATTASGWTLVAKDTITGGTATFIYAKIAGSGESTTQAPVTTTQSSYTLTIFEISSAKSPCPIAFTGSTGFSNSTTATSVSCAVCSLNASGLVVGVVATDTAAVTTLPTSVTGPNTMSLPASSANNKAVQAFDCTAGAVGTTTTVTANYAASTALRICAVYIGG